MMTLVPACMMLSHACRATTKVWSELASIRVQNAPPASNRVSPTTTLRNLDHTFQLSAYLSVV